MVIPFPSKKTAKNDNNGHAASLLSVSFHEVIEVVNKELAFARTGDLEVDRRIEAISLLLDAALKNSEEVENEDGDRWGIRTQVPVHAFLNGF